MGRRFVPLLLICATLSQSTNLLACPFCTAVSQTLRQEMASMDAVVVAEATEAIEPSDTGEVELTVKVVLKGEKLVKVDQRVKSVYFGKAEKGRRFMLTGVDPPELMWSSPLPLTKRSEDYLLKLTKLPDDDIERLVFFQEFLEDEEDLLARDAYDEFAVAPYSAVKALAPKMHHDQLIEWIKNPEVASDRRRLYLTMLGVCGDKKDVPMLEAMLTSTQKSTRGGLDALIACYLTLNGADGLPVVNELFLDNKKAEYADTYAAIMALRFHGTETDVIPKEQLVSSLHHVLKRPQLADLVIPDLARWGDWSQIDALVDLFKTAEAGNNWVRVPVINYLRACPLPEAAAALVELEKVDPAAVRRANTFFPVPASDAPKKDAETSQISDSPAAGLVQTLDSGKPLAAAAVVVPQVVQPVTALPAVNPLRLLFVSSITATSLTILIWLVISGGTLPAQT
ncbi:hypothetical protein Poly24_09200 [Rosistilla carotiformis]|uniref:Uncharacterized protein n=1 Tax=Rosistilla carotiformis TaxID=2528017 RepID=A0A518JNV5_9BACT|nr:hypothetical protein [Rosistilla carotiformis]QDV67227.1 hypothetical protein Poly24_09200 [Rosistilla carotiformis]